MCVGGVRKGDELPGGLLHYTGRADAARGALSHDVCEDPAVRSIHGAKARNHSTREQEARGGREGG